MMRAVVAAVLAIGSNLPTPATSISDPPTTPTASTPTARRVPGSQGRVGVEADRLMGAGSVRHAVAVGLHVGGDGLTCRVVESDVCQRWVGRRQRRRGHEMGLRFVDP